MNFRVIGLIKVVPASKFRGDWSYKSLIRKNDLLEQLENSTSNWNFRLKYVKKSEFSSDWSYKSQIRKNDLLQQLENLTFKLEFSGKIGKKIRIF